MRQIAPPGSHHDELEIEAVTNLMRESRLMIGENVEIFEALTGLRQQLSVGSMAEKAVENLKSWSEEFATPVRLPTKSALAGRDPAE